MRVAELMLDILAAHGVRQIFGVPGDAINDLTFALRKRDDMEFVLVRHEEAGAFAAAAQAKLTGRLAACLGSSGPGAIHLLNGLYDAKLDHAPVIAVTGQVATEYVGTDYHQEVDLERLFSDVAEYSRTVMTETQLPGVMLQACKAALAAPGVAHVSVPTNVSGRDTKIERRDFAIGSEKGEMRPCAPSLASAVQTIERADEVAILAGIGAAGARAELLALSERLEAPIVRTLRAKDVIDEDEEACVGGVGLLGGAPGSAAMEDADALIIVGADYPYTSFYPEKAEIVQIEAAPARMGKRAAVAAPLRGHAKPTLTDLLGQLSPKSSDAFYAQLQEVKAKQRSSWAKAEASGASPLKPQRVMAEIAAAAPPDAVFVCDTGTSTAWSARHLRVREGQRYTLSSGLGSMAYALPGAIGAQLAYPDRAVFAIAGDGAFAMLMADFVTAVRYGLGIICVVLNNKKLGFIALEQQGKGLPEHAVDLVNPDFAAFAEACGGRGVNVDRPDELAKALKAAVDADAPTVLDVQVDPNELIIPPKITPAQAYQFGVARMRELLS